MFDRNKIIQFKIIQFLLPNLTAMLNLHNSVKHLILHLLTLIKNIGHVVSSYAQMNTDLCFIC